MEDDSTVRRRGRPTSATPPKTAAERKRASRAALKAAGLRAGGSQRIPEPFSTDLDRFAADKLRAAAAAAGKPIYQVLEELIENNL